MNNISEVSKKECYGCTACTATCPTNSIKMVSDKEGFLAPVIDNHLCVNCGKCKSVCPALNRWNADDVDNHYYGFQNIDAVLLEKSTSGGAFSACVDAFKPDKVCGCIEDELLYIRHIVADSNNIEPMIGSKYVQSDMGDCFKVIKNKILIGESVLFTGTSCQVHGLLNYLKIESVPTEKLLTMDLICHGVPSNKMHQEYIRYYEDKRKSKPIYHKFRTKRQGWGTKYILKNHEQTIVQETNRIDYCSLESQMYANVFFSDYCLREACYDCPYCSENKPADITMADFWGIEDTDIEIDIDKGCSFLIARNKGIVLIDEIPGVFELKDYQANIAKKYQKHLFVPNDRPYDRDSFWNDYEAYGFDYIAKGYLHTSFIYKLLMKCFNFANRFHDKRYAMFLGSKIFY